MNQQPEIWKDIKGFEGFYQVSTLGRVKSLPRGKRKGKVLTLFANNSGYLYVDLSINGNKFRSSVHRLVAKAFIAKPALSNAVNHKNLDKTDNSVENLEWVSFSENTRHAIKNSHFRHRSICQLTIDGEVIKIWPSISSATKEGFIGPIISRCCRGKQSIHKGFKWMYL